jgi:hypothetical protein
VHIYFPLISSGQLQKLIDSDSNGERNASSSHYDETDEYINRMTSSKSSSLTATAEARQQDQDAIVSNSGTADKTIHENILTFSAVQRLNWDVIFLLGGGFALSKVRVCIDIGSFQSHGGIRMLCIVYFLFRGLKRRG